MATVFSIPNTFFLWGQVDYEQSALADAGVVTLEFDRLLSFFSAFAWLCLDQTDKATRSAIGVAIGFTVLFLMPVIGFMYRGNFLKGWQALKTLRHTPMRLMRYLARLKNDLSIWRSMRNPGTTVRRSGIWQHVELWSSNIEH